MMPSPHPPRRTVILQDQALRRLKGFTQVPNAVLCHRLLSHGAKLTFGVLLSYAWQDDFCFPAQERLAADMGCSIRQVRRFLVELRRYRFVDWKQQGLNLPNVYYILPQTRWILDAGTATANSGESGPDRTDLSHPDRTPVAGQDGTPVSDKEYPTNNTHVDNVDKEFPRKEGMSGRRLTRDEYAQATALALQIQDTIGQPTNYRFYFTRAAEAVKHGSRGIQALMEVLSTTKQAMLHGNVRRTPSQYLHGAWSKVLPTLGPELPPRTQRVHSDADQSGTPDAIHARSAVQDFLARPRGRGHHQTDGW